MTKRKHLYVCFVNWGDGGEVHLRRCKVVHESGRDLVIDIVYDDDYDEKSVTDVILGKDAIAKGQYASSEEAFRYRCHEEMNHHEWGPTWNTLYATPGATREDALKHQKARMECKIQRFEDRIKVCENIIAQIDETLNEGAPINTYDTEWNRVERSTLELLALQAED